MQGERGGEGGIAGDEEDRGGGIGSLCGAQGFDFAHHRRVDRKCGGVLRSEGHGGPDRGADPDRGEQHGGRGQAREEGKGQSGGGQSGRRSRFATQHKIDRDKRRDDGGEGEEFGLAGSADFAQREKDRGSQRDEDQGGGARGGGAHRGGQGGEAQRGGRLPGSADEVDPAVLRIPSQQPGQDG